MADAIRVLLVDDHAVVREGLRNFLALQDGLEIVGEASDGAGFDPGAAGLRSTHLGLTSMEERARRLGGTLSIDSARGRGTTVRLETDAG